MGLTGSFSPKVARLPNGAHRLRGRSKHREGEVRRVLAVLSIVAMAATLAVGAAAPASAGASEESAFVSRINGLRQNKGLAPLAVSGNLTSIGRSWSQQMMERGSLSHNPNYARQVTADWVKLGENVGRGSSVDSLFQAFVNSSAHYRNLVDPAFTHVGVGVVTAPDGTLWTSHQFMQVRSAAPAAAAPAPTGSAPVARTASAPRAASSGASAGRARPAPAGAPAPPPPPPKPTERVVLSLEQLRTL